jgi:integrase
VAKIVGKRRTAGATNATIRRDLTAMSRVLSACCQWELRVGNPARDFDRRTIEERREPIRPPDDQDIAIVIARAPGQLAALIRFLAFEGCRQEEAAGLTWPQVRLSRCEVFLTKTKTDRPRVIRIGVETVKLLSALPRHLNSKMVFRHGDGERYCNVASRFREIVKSAQKAAQTKGRDFTRFGAMTSDIAMRSANWKRGVTFTI